MEKEAENERVDRAIRACQELIELSRANYQAFADGNLDLLSKVLAQRDGLISSIDVAGPGIGNGGGASPVSGMNELLSEKLSELLRIDEENRMALQARLAEVKDQIAGLSHGRHALREYACIKPQAGPAYVDRRR